MNKEIKKNIKELISQKELEKIKSIKGEIRGFSFKILEDFIRREKGEEGLKEIMREMKQIGYSIDFKKIKSMDYYPISYLNAIFAIARKFYNFDGEKYKQFGIFRVKSSLFLRLYMNYFGSLDKLVNNATKLWRKSTTIGDVDVTDFDKKKKYMVIKLSNYSDFAPEQCLFFCGIFSAMIQMLNKKEVSCQETKCTFKGDAYHEFLLKW